MKKVSLDVGVFCPSLKAQLLKQGFRFTPVECRALRFMEQDRRRILRLSSAGYFSASVEAAVWRKFLRKVRVLLGCSCANRKG